MPLIVEDGTGKPDSEVLCDLAFADSYHADRGNTLWATMLQAEKEASLRRGYEYMQQTYRLRWAGYRVTTTQALDWPRQDVPRIDDAVRSIGGSYGRFGAAYYPSDVIPLEIKQANAILAFKAASGELIEDVSQAIKSETVGPLETVYQDHSTSVKRYLVVDRLLSPFLQGSGNIKLVRA